MAKKRQSVRTAHIIKIKIKSFVFVTISRPLKKNFEIFKQESFFPTFRKQEGSIE